jgi:hypothetical protein
VVAIRRVKRFSFFLFSSEAPTYLNSDRGEKLREDQWLISAILREINHLGRSGWSGSLKHLGRTKELGKEPTARGLVGSLGKVMPAAFYSGSPDSNRQSNLVTISGMTGSGPTTVNLHASRAMASAGVGFSSFALFLHRLFPAAFAANVTTGSRR